MCSLYFLVSEDLLKKTKPQNKPTTKQNTAAALYTFSVAVHRIILLPESLKIVRKPPNPCKHTKPQPKTATTKTPPPPTTKKSPTNQWESPPSPPPLLCGCGGKSVLLINFASQSEDLRQPVVLDSCLLFWGIFVAYMLMCSKECTVWKVLSTAYECMAEVFKNSQV